MKTLLPICVAALVIGAFAWWTQANPREATIEGPDAWIYIYHGAPPHCSVTTDENATPKLVPCGEIGSYLKTIKSLPQGARVRITAYNSDGIPWDAVRAANESVTAAGYVNAGIFTPKAGFVQE